MNHSCVRIRWRAPDDLRAALTAYARAIRAHRRLARLAPRFFDEAVIRREADNRAEQRRWMALWEPALARAYGREPESRAPENNLPPLPSPRIQRAVDRQLATLQLWMEAGRSAMKRQQQRHPHARLSLTHIVRLTEQAIAFKKLALGLDSPNPLPAAISYDYELTNLKRAYGRPNVMPPPAVAVAGGPGVPSSHSPATASAPTLTAPPLQSGIVREVAARQDLPPEPPPWPPPDDKRDLTPHRLVIGPHGLLCLQRIAEGESP